MKRPTRATVLTVAVTVPLSVAVGALAPALYDAITLGASASSIANQLGCTDYKQEANHSVYYRHADAGTCTYHKAHLRVVTFSHGSDSESFQQTVRLIGLTANQGGAFASATGWNISDPSYDLAVAETVAEKMGGSVVNLPVAKQKTTSKPTPAASGGPTVKAPSVKKK